MVVVEHPRHSGDGRGGRGMVVRCRCDCGVERDFRLSRMTRTRSCGCARNAAIAKIKPTDVTSGRFCPMCYDLPHRRPTRRPCDCGEMREELPPITAELCAQLAGGTSPAQLCVEAR